VAQADLPYVDGRNLSPAELRAEVAKESDPQVQHIEEVRDELSDVVDELGRRAAPRSWVARVPSGVWAGLVVAAAAKQFTGLVAQEMETLFPEMVSQRAGFIDGEPVSDIRQLDTSPLVYALINAVKELKAEIDALKAQLAPAGR